MVPRLAIVSGQRRRRAVRYNLPLPVIFRWSDETGEHTEGGFTRDVALDGVFIVSSACPPEGSDVRIEVLFPLSNGDSGQLGIRCSGKVTHVEGGARCTGFGVHAQFDDDDLTQYVPMRRESEVELRGSSLNRVEPVTPKRDLKSPSPR